MMALGSCHLTCHRYRCMQYTCDTVQIWAGGEEAREQKIAGFKVGSKV
jgi:hypothetical protein